MPKRDQQSNANNLCDMANDDRNGNNEMESYTCRENSKQKSVHVVFKRLVLSQEKPAASVYRQDITKGGGESV